MFSTMLDFAGASQLLFVEEMYVTRQNLAVGTYYTLISNNSF